MEYATPEDQPLSRVADIATNTAGNVAVLDDQRARAYLFDAAGMFLRLIARSGPGPGELHMPRRIQILDDSVVLIASNAPARLQRFTLTGDRLSAVRLDLQGFGSDIINVVPDWELAAGGTNWAGLRQYTRATVDGDSIAYALVHMDPDGRPSEPVLETRLPGRSTEDPAVLWQPHWMWAAGDSLLVASMGDPADIHIFDRDGTRRRTITSADPAVELDETARASLEDGFIRMRMERGDGPASIEEGRQVLDVPRHFPRIYGFIVSDNGEQFWARVVSTAWDRRWPVEWIWEVYGADGQFLACAEMPDRFLPMVVANGRVLGVATDELDVPHVVGFTLSGPTRGPARGGNLPHPAQEPAYVRDADTP
jgi:hypothetical protein